MTIRIEGLEPLIERIKYLETFKHTKAAIVTAGKWVKRKARLYPQKSSRRQPFKTAKSRRYFFWALRKGIIKVPYRRTMTLKNAWTNAQTNSGWGQIITNAVSYAPLVQGQGSQAQYHATTGWNTEAEVAQEEAREVYRIIEEGIEEDVANG